MPRRFLVLAVGMWVVLCPGRARAFDEIAGRERLGLRAGGITTFGDLNDAYGGGWDLTLCFDERLASHVRLDIRLGAIYLGDLKFTELDDVLTLTPGITASMRLFYFSAGPAVGMPLGSGYTVYGSAAVGVYSVSINFDPAIAIYDYSDQDIGFLGGLGLARRVAANWSFDLNGTVHYVLVQKDIRDVYYAFTDGAGSPLVLEIAAGVTLDLR